MCIKYVFKHTIHGHLSSEPRGIGYGLSLYQRLSFVFGSSEGSGESACTHRLTRVFAASMLAYGNSTYTKFHELAHYYNPMVALTCTQAVLASLPLQTGSTWNTLQERKFASIIASENNMRM